jgi:toxin ParE1/3/4
VTDLSRHIIWSENSSHNLASIRAYIAEFDPQAASRLTQRLITAVESLSQSPNRGRPVHNGLRELVVITPHIVCYRVTDDAIEVVRIKHGAQRPD